MGRCIIKPARDDDFYVEWSSIGEDVVACGDRAEMLDMLREDEGARFIRELAEKRLDRADEFGSSALSPRVYLWDEDRLICRQQWLNRSDLKAYALALCTGFEAAADGYLTRITDENA